MLFDVFLPFVFSLIQVACLGGVVVGAVIYAYTGILRTHFFWVLCWAVCLGGLVVGSILYAYIAHTFFSDLVLGSICLSGVVVGAVIHAYTCILHTHFFWSCFG